MNTRAERLDGSAALMPQRGRPPGNRTLERDADTSGHFDALQDESCAPSCTALIGCSRLRSLRHLLFNRMRGWLLAGAFVLFVLSAAGQARYRPLYTEPDWFTFHVTEASSGLYTEGVFDQTTYTQSGSSVSHEHFFIGPSVGLSFDGSVYHPNLLRYQVVSDGAFGWGYDSVTGEPSRNEWQYLGRFAGTIDFLNNKPYHASAFANYDHTFRDNDFFSRVTVDSWRYGGHVGWEAGPWSVSADYGHRDETSTSPFPVIRTVTVTNIINGTNVITVKTNQTSVDQDMITHDDNVNFNVRNSRAQGGTALTYAWS